jgi:hypothetical protein
MDMDDDINSKDLKIVMNRNHICKLYKQQDAGKMVNEHYMLGGRKLTAKCPAHIHSNL